MMEKNVAVEAPKQQRDLIIGAFRDCEVNFTKIMVAETGK